MKTITTITTITTMLVLALAACGKSGGGDGKATCDDVETAMRRIDPDRTKDVKAGAFAKVCRSKPGEFDQARIDCTVKAQSSLDLAVCADPTGAAAAAKPAPAPAPAPAPSGPPAAPAWKKVPKYGVQVRAPGDTTVEENDRNVHVGNGVFKLNLFGVDEYSSESAAAQKASLQKEPGFVKFLVEEAAGKTWRYDYELEGGKFGTSSRIVIGGTPLDCGVHKVDKAILDAVSSGCATAKPL
jgi:hypothetical protein